MSSPGEGVGGAAPNCHQLQIAVIALSITIGVTLFLSLLLSCIGFAKVAPPDLELEPVRRRRRRRRRPYIYNSLHHIGGGGYVGGHQINANNSTGEDGPFEAAIRPGQQRNDANQQRNDANLQRNDADLQPPRQPPRARLEAA